MTTGPIPNPQEQLSQLFGSYKAEWLKEQLFELFTEPAYFPELTTSRPCMLVGGRGTGKTTVLRCLSYVGQFALNRFQKDTIANCNYYGFYYRVNTNRVTAFNGPEIEAQQWTRLFAHYLNLVICDLVFEFLIWYELQTSKPLEIDVDCFLNISLALHLNPSRTLKEITKNIESAKIKFEAFINNVVDSPTPRLSLQGSPIDLLFKSLCSMDIFKGKMFFILLDEYENLQDYQQQVINTLIKHSGSEYTFKVGVRELGWRTKITLNTTEQLISPADYVKINITEKLEGDRFSQFAKYVCNERVKRIKDNEGKSYQEIDAIFPGLSEEAEAKELGVLPIVADIKQELLSRNDPKLLELVNTYKPLELYFLKVWSDANNQEISQNIKNWEKNRTEWKTRYDNYKHSLLYSIKKGKRGIRKYYSGWNVFVQIAGCNIRYLLELVEQSLLLHLNQGGQTFEAVTQELQTEAAKQIGRKNLSELEGLSVHGAKLTKLVLGLGRVFQVMAEQAAGHAPEVNQFYIRTKSEFRINTEPNGPKIEEEVDSLLKTAVMHLALLRFPGSKLGDEGDTKDYDYMVHPIFSPFFDFSHRKKRKFLLSEEEIMGLIKQPQVTIREVLSRNNRILPEDDLPEQLKLFEGYYYGS